MPQSSFNLNAVYVNCEMCIDLNPYFLINCNVQYIDLIRNQSIYRSYSKFWIYTLFCTFKTIYIIPYYVSFTYISYSIHCLYTLFYTLYRS